LISSIASKKKLANDVLLFYKILLGYKKALWPQKIGDKSCQSNSDKRASDFGSFLVI
jgi:hypothetical protein